MRTLGHQDAGLSLDACSRPVETPDENAGRSLGFSGSNAGPSLAARSGAARCLTLESHVARARRVCDLSGAA